MKLSILICSIPKRYLFLSRLINCFQEQLGQPIATNYLKHSNSNPYELYRYNYGEVEMLIAIDNEKISIGDKRNLLLNNAQGEYVSFFDDDDEPTPIYISEAMEGISKGVDACSLIGLLTTNGERPQTFIHSMEYNGWFEKDKILYRFINHLNVIKKSIAASIGYAYRNHGEDRDYSERLQKSGLVKTEYKVKDTIYLYKYISGKPHKK